MAGRDRVGVLHHIDGKGTCLVPALVLSRAGTAVNVLIEVDGAFTTKTAIAEYAEPPSLPETVTAWQPHWQRLEQAAGNR